MKIVRDEILFLNEDDVLDLLRPVDAIAAAKDTFRYIGTGDITVGSMALLFADDAKRNNFHSMPAILHHRKVAGVKWIDTFANPLAGYNFSHGNLVIVSSTQTGSPLAIVGATNITNMRTAGGHGVVQAQYLANPNPSVLTVIGCGAQARSGIRGFLAHFASIHQVRIFSRSEAPILEVKREYAERAEVLPCTTPAEAVQGSNLVLMASGADTPLVTAEMIQAGTTIIGIEGFRDLDPRIAKLANKWYLGYREPDMHILRSPHLNPNLSLTIDEVFGDMTEVLNGKVPAHEHEKEIIVSTHMGMGAHDVNCAYTLYLRALEQGRGVKLLV